ncbi:hypothetical protein E4U54_002420 [Claviceps lovelessii]|nr:hypothetical protein E4U54_002420 [Claviceps lovelessii]
MVLDTAFSGGMKLLPIRTASSDDCRRSSDSDNVQDADEAQDADGAQGAGELMRVLNHLGGLPPAFIPHPLGHALTPSGVNLAGWHSAVWLDPTGLRDVLDVHVQKSWMSDVLDVRRPGCTEVEIVPVRAASPRLQQRVHTIRPIQTRPPDARPHQTLRSRWIAR